MTLNKTRKRTGRTEARLVKPRMKYKEVQVQAIEPLKFWDDWKDKKRDGLRSKLPKDQLYHHCKGCLMSKEEVKKHNARIKKLIKIRKGRK